MLDFKQQNVHNYLKFAEDINGAPRTTKKHGLLNEISFFFLSETLQRSDVGCAAYSHNRNE